MPSCLLGVLDWYTPFLLAGCAIIFMVTWLVLWFIGIDLRGGRDSVSLALSSLALTGLLYVTISLAIIGIPWWLLGIYIFFLAVSVFMYLGSIYGDEVGNKRQ